MKRNKPKVSRFRRRKDEQLLRRYSRFKYQEVRQKVAREGKCDLAQVRSKIGTRKALKEGFDALRSWWEGLGSDVLRKMARDKIVAEMQMGQGKEVAQVIVDDPMPAHEV